MTPEELREEKKWRGEIISSPSIIIEELSFQEQIEYEDEARDFAKRMQAAIEGAAVDLRKPPLLAGPALVRYGDEEFEDDEEEGEDVGSLAEELASAFNLIDRMIWFFKELDIERVELPSHIEKESQLLYIEAKNFIDRMELNKPRMVEEAITK